MFIYTLVESASRSYLSTLPFQCDTLLNNMRHIHSFLDVITHVCMISLNWLMDENIKQVGHYQ